MNHKVEESTREKISISLKKRYKENPEIIERQNDSRRKYLNDKDKIKKSRDKFLETLKDNPSIMEKASEKRHRTFIGNPTIIKKIVEYRKNQILPFMDTSIELKIQNFLKQLGVDFFTHQYIKEIEHGYQCDILISSMNLVIECDGDYWHKYPIGTEIDHIRTKELLEKGFKVLRLWEHEIKLMNLENFKNKIMGGK